MESRKISIKSNIPVKPPDDKPTLPGIILAILGLGVALSILLIAPNLVQIVDMFGRKHTFSRKHVKETFKRLEKRGIVKRRGAENTSWNYTLTSEGKNLLKKKVIETMSIEKPKQWDGLWRIVIFDIPEQRKEARYALRSKLKDLGFRYVNLSVWIFPYECQNEINAVAEFYNVGRYVRFMRVDYFDGSEEFKRKFGLS